MVILIVEDSPVNAKMIVAMLGRLNYELVTVASGEEALEFVAGQHPDLILLDIGLPGISGYEVAQALRADPATAHIPIIASTGSTLPSDLEEAARAGCSDVIGKPIDMGALQEKIAAYLSPE